ncbi:tRNA (adenosine(37)-N6)-threonylcarbamoyltransferase complex transferase subunit TsaD [bacterium]|nr:tRNA (adenosine(37)-N6)-threonylcarbamoyltransferase complex transferase subunit TsaD [bacterium]
MIVLGIESSCDETAVAILEDGKLLSNVVASQVDLHARFGGVVPELASRKHIETIIPLIQEALENAGKSLEEIDGIAATFAPGLVGALLVGLSTAKALAYTINRPIVGVNHLEAHLNAPFLAFDDIPYPFLALVVSGGHTSLYLTKEFGDYKLLGSTRDDAAGEAFDKVAKLLDLGYPGGPIIDKLSAKGDSKKFKFTKPKFDGESLDFSFSGIKTAVLYHYQNLVKENKFNEQTKLDLIASFQETVVDILSERLFDAAEQNSCKAVVVSGGVAANKHLRAKVEKLAKEKGAKAFIPPIQYCTDNAAMIAYVGWKRLLLGQTDDMSLNARANMELGT